VVKATAVAARDEAVIDEIEEQSSRKRRRRKLR
jgi:hypothetical protein